MEMIPKLDVRRAQRLSSQEREVGDALLRI